MEIIPSILTNSPEEGRALLNLCEGVVSRAHIDIIDSEFAQNKTITPDTFEGELYTTKLDFHLMVNEPIKWITRSARANADRIIAQIELMDDQVTFCKEVLDRNILAGLAIDLDTEIEKIDEAALSLIDVIVVMSVPAGFGGQMFDPRAFKKITDLAQIREAKELGYKICDDGGVTLEIPKKLERAGADEISVGRRLFHGDLEKNIEDFKRAMAQ